jgi:Fic family protein
MLVTHAPEPFRAFIPRPLPPDPALDLDTTFYGLFEQANRALGRLDGVTMLLPDISLFLYLYIRKEALLSSQIEGTQSSLSDLLLYESKEVAGIPLDDVREVSNYVAAMNYGLARLREGFPLSLRLFRELHAILLAEGRGSDKTPGEFRRSQNWIGGTRPGNAAFVPPPPGEVLRCMGELEKFLHDDPVRTPTLIKTALAHVQFETIHPFLDGNGRLGRLLITFLLCAEGAVSEPLLYLSVYFKTHRTEYYGLLQKVRLEGAWGEWLRFFLIGVRETADQAAQAAKHILQLFERDRRRMDEHGRVNSSTLRVHQLLQAKPLVTIAEATQRTGLSTPTVAAALANLEEVGIVREITGRKRGRVYLYDEYLAILNEGTEPLAMR